MDIIINAKGGQQATEAAGLMVLAADFEGKFGQSHPSFICERKGTPIRTFLRLDDQPITIRNRVYTADCNVFADRRMVDVMDLAQGLKEGGTVILDAPKKPSNLRLNGKIKKAGIVDATGIANKLLGPAFLPQTGLPIMAALAATTGFVSLDAIIKAIRQRMSGDEAWRAEEAVRLAYETTKVLG